MNQQKKIVAIMVAIIPFGIPLLLTAVFFVQMKKRYAAHAHC